MNADERRTGGGGQRTLVADPAVQAERPFLSSSSSDDLYPPDWFVVRGAEPAAQTKKPSLYQVLLHNDDYTPMEFVIEVLQSFFRKDLDEATQIMLHVHQNGVGTCGVYPYDVAETKVVQVTECAREHQHPLQCTLEKV